jgi:hypothetical protein
MAEAARWDMGRQGRGEHMEWRGEMTGAKDRRERQRRVREGGGGREGSVGLGFVREEAERGWEAHAHA